MPKLIDRNGVRADQWVSFNGDAGTLAPDQDVIVPLDVWREYKARWSGRTGRIGVLLSPADDVALLAPDLAQIALVAVSFPSFTDGRGYSQARLLRERFQFAGEVRAVGEILIDQLFYLQRCGVETFALRDDQDLPSAQRAFAAFSDSYQTTVNQAPLFRRRAASAPASAADIAHAA